MPCTFLLVETFIITNVVVTTMFCLVKLCTHSLLCVANFLLRSEIFELLNENNWRCHPFIRISKTIVKELLSIHNLKDTMP